MLIHTGKVEAYFRSNKEGAYYSLIKSINDVYKKNKACTPIFNSFLCNQNSITNLVYYTPTSILSQHFQERFKEANFLCGHYGIAVLNAGWDLSRRRRKENDPKPMFVDKTNKGSRTKRVGVFVFTFYMKPNVIWEETFVPMVHDNSFIHCRFECISHLEILKIQIDENFSRIYMKQLQNETPIDFLCRNEWVSNANERTRTIYNPSILRFFISFDDIRNSNKIIPVKLICLHHIQKFLDFYTLKNETCGGSCEFEITSTPTDTQDLSTNEASGELILESEMIRTHRECDKCSLLQEDSLLRYCNMLGQKEGSIGDYGVLTNQMHSHYNMAEETYETIENVSSRDSVGHFNQDTKQTLMEPSLIEFYNKLNIEIVLPKIKPKIHFKNTLCDPWQLNTTFD